ncbi:hypothetical protein Ae201684P_003541 [Aphanomyces euteiches]|uniref:Uncharacterized protein n=1 Tax=Aphanomyces euteiches TaxID=100861 RepID=A0A6G0W814_9STRA|nr:hypothetical protein Ae201684_017770 [Aphanomyces euteiches]KAH9064758.1 hypothetical protein Ae201684P_003541 [Aphanomyces euteiches]
MPRWGIPGLERLVKLAIAMFGSIPLVNFPPSPCLKRCKSRLRTVRRAKFATVAVGNMVYYFFSINEIGFDAVNNDRNTVASMDSAIQQTQRLERDSLLAHEFKGIATVEVNTPKWSTPLKLTMIAASHH